MNHDTAWQGIAWHSTTWHAQHGMAQLYLEKQQSRRVQRVAAAEREQPMVLMWVSDASWAGLRVPAGTCQE